MPRITRISGSFAIVLIAYWAYALVLVPWIEPPADLLPSGETADSLLNAGPDLLTQQMLQIKPLFKPDDWEVASTDTKVLESDAAILLLRKYTNLGDGRVKIEPCTIVFLSNGPAENEAQLLRQSIILQAPDGAILQFDHPIDLKQPREANLIGGQLLGKVTIHSDWKQPGPEDDLRIDTSNIRLANQTISTPDPVEFHWGPNFGYGQDMQIKLLPGPRKAGV